MSEENKDEMEQARPCPICGKPARIDYRPFCSKRCADIDLHRWLTGSYTIPAEPEAEHNEALPDDRERDDRG